MIANRTVNHLRCEYRHNPLGIDVLQPRLSWQMQSDRRGSRQTAYQVLAAASETDLKQKQNLLWDSGKVESDQAVHIVYAGEPLQSCQRVFWKVTVWDDKGDSGESEVAWWEMGLLQRSDWRAAWIGGGLVGGPRTSVPAPYLRRMFTLANPPVAARAYVTALGVYELHLNGSVVHEDVLSPGWTDFRKQVRYQVYDITAHLRAGENVIGAILGDGWYCGHVEWRDRQTYGDRPKLLLQLRLLYEDGSVEFITSDGSWKVAYGPLLEADIIQGEAYDARLEMPGWDAPGFDVSRWLPVEKFPDPGMALVAYNGPAVRRMEEIQPAAEPIELPGQWPLSRIIFDLGQNITGRVRLKLTGERGTTIRIRHGEMLTEDGKLYTENLRSARATDYYTLRGGGEEVWEPRFTFHGFRYVEIIGWKGRLTREAVTGIVLHSDCPPTGEFECSDPLLNQLQHNIQWGQKGNWVDIPTDCPQRDERLGWTGDLQVFSRTAAFNMNVAPFLTKWLQDLVDAQGENGAYPAVAPDPSQFWSDGHPVWADAGIIIPWNLYLCYGDKRLLERQYPSMQKYMDFQLSVSPGYIRCHPDVDPWGGFGDWLALDGGGKTEGITPKDLIGTAFLALDAKLMAQIADVLGKAEDAEKYTRLAAGVKEAFIHRFVTGDGLLTSGTQTTHVLALYFDLLPEAVRPKALAALVKDIQARKMHLATGFVGTPYLLHLLSDEGRLDVAYALLLQKTWPCWLYSVTQGATTIWERWDGWTEDKGFQDPGMNSFNHYAYGSVGSWMYQVVAGIEADFSQPGYKHIILKPQPGGGLEYARAAYDSLHGRIVSDWRVADGFFDWQISVPPNTTATIHVPVLEDAPVMECGEPADQAEGVTLVRREKKAAVYHLQSGHYHFSTDLSI